MSLSKADRLSFNILESADIPVRTYKTGDEIIRAGEPSTEMFVVRKGKVAIQVHGRTIEEIADEIGADSLAYLSMAGVYAAIGGSPDEHCDACFSGNYP
ncbi:MAG TPA: cyclic nucleotide-binding domain-containing protein, partial [Bauldia sp.]|nr:cyclic nucleotide-binding domain-containing protein [Bauldia sp.]